MSEPDSRQSIRIILLAAILLVVPVFIVTSKLSFRLDGDYDASFDQNGYSQYFASGELLVWKIQDGRSVE